ncbi:hypothetical protein [Deinococcus sp. SL84]|uniref:hypothetical protein n=1 Tax=Deinococcus sp. SL84 TaxID=2994663 RepID=UPI00227662DA|nr:hypothetical protein [Deinococcus sp. SL84]MCY1703966.1 hypothetical protein [Deinococcus sp. SL84]
MLRRVSIPQLLARAGYRQKMTGRLYQEAFQALKDLAAARYEAEACWRVPSQEKSYLRNLMFGLIYRLEEHKETHMFNPKQNLHLFDIHIDENVAQSITGPLTLALNLDIIDNLVSPQARGLYRITESVRRDGDNPAYASERISIPVPSLRTMMRILSTKTAASALIYNLSVENGPLEQLKKAGYLESFDTTGRGEGTVLHFKFNEKYSLINVKVLERLNSLGVVGDVAKALAANTTMQEVDKAEEMVEQQIKKQAGTSNPVRRPAALLITLLRDGSASDELKREREQHKNKRLSIRKPSTPAHQSTKAESTEAGASSDTTEEALKNLKLICNFRLKTSTLDKQDEAELQQLVESGKIKPAEVRKWLTLKRRLGPDRPLLKCVSGT